MKASMMDALNWGAARMEEAAARAAADKAALADLMASRLAKQEAEHKAALARLASRLSEAETRLTLAEATLRKLGDLDGLADLAARLTALGAPPTSAPSARLAIAAQPAPASIFSADAETIAAEAARLDAEAQAKLPRTGPFSGEAHTGLADAA